MKESIKTECGSCGGTGIYCGFAEPEGTGVICFNCDGSGCRIIEYVPFTSRKERRNVSKVMRSRGTFIGTGVGPVGDYITYEDFLKGKKP
jgi:hypothetical protein